jgi:tRNA synthetases class II (A)
MPFGAVDETELDQIGPRFLAFLREHGFTETPSAPLTAADASVTFVNASITPFKPQLLRGARVGRTCQVQQCLRATGREPWLYVFGMLGMLADIEHLPDVIEHTPRVLPAAAPWVTPDRLAVAIDQEHGDLRDIVKSRADIEIGDVRHEDVPTRWSYGRDGALTGRGLTFFHRGDAPPCGPDCALGCRCGRWQELGQVIEVSTPRGTYVEAGFGMEIIQALTCGGDLYELPALRAETDRLCAEGVPTEMARQAANLTRALSALVQAGLRPGAKGGASVMRRFVRDLLTCLDAGEFAADGWQTRVRGLVPREEVADMVIAEAERWRASRRKAVAAASAYLRRNPSATAELLTTTYGIEMAQARRLCEKQASG